MYRICYEGAIAVVECSARIASNDRATLAWHDHTAWVGHEFGAVVDARAALARLDHDACYPQCPGCLVRPLAGSWLEKCTIYGFMETRFCYCPVAACFESSHGVIVHDCRWSHMRGNAIAVCDKN